MIAAGIDRLVRNAYDRKVRYAKSDGKGRWITIGSTGNEDGTPVKIDSDGKIVAGSKGLADKGINRLSDFGKSDRKKATQGNPEKHRENTLKAKVDPAKHPKIAGLDDAAKKLRELLERATALQTDAAVAEEKTATLHKTNRSTGPNSLGCPRHQMPQIPGEHKKEFLDYLDLQNVDVSRRAIKVSDLSPVQSEVNGETVDKMAEQLLSTGSLGGTDPIVSSDGYVFDGHHRWAAHQSVSKDERMIVHQADLPIKTLLTVARSFPKSFKVGQDGRKSKYAAASDGEPLQSLRRSLYAALQPLAASNQPTRYAKWEESKHSRDSSGRFTSGSEGGGSAAAAGGGSGVAAEDKPAVDHAAEAVALAKRTPNATPQAVYAELEKDYGVQNPSGHDTQSRYQDTQGNYSPKRTAVHDAIVGRALAGVEPDDSPVAVFMGGGPASGKSSIIKTGLVELPNGGKGVVDPDGIKAQLPEYAAGVEIGDDAAAAYSHEESSDVASRIVREAIDSRFSHTLDGVGNSDYEKMAAKVARVRDGGHRAVAHYVTCDTQEAERRSMERAKKTGRMVPLDRLRASHQNVSEIVERAAQESLFDELTLWDTNSPSGKPVKVMESRGGETQIHDEKLWQRFLAKKAK